MRSPSRTIYHFSQISPRTEKGEEMPHFDLFYLISAVCARRIEPAEDATAAPHCGDLIRSVGNKLCALTCVWGLPDQVASGERRRR